jgi:hypothetical protein
MKKRQIFGMLLLVSLFFVYGCAEAEEGTLSLDDMQMCFDDSECTYADNSCCPMTDGENVIAINAGHVEDYAAMGPECDADVGCQENAIEPQNVACVDNVCSFTGY